MKKITIFPEFWRKETPEKILIYLPETHSIFLLGKLESLFWENIVEHKNLKKTIRFFEEKGYPKKIPLKIAEGLKKRRLILYDS